MWNNIVSCFLCIGTIMIIAGSFLIIKNHFKNKKKAKEINKVEFDNKAKEEELLVKFCKKVNITNYVILGIGIFVFIVNLIIYLVAFK